MVTKFPPLPAQSGGKLRSLAVARALAARGDVVLCCFDDGVADVEGLRAMGIDVRTVPWRPDLLHVARGLARNHSGAVARFWDADLAAVVRGALAEAPTDVLQVEYSHLIPYLWLGEARTKVLDLHNIESSLAESYARGGRTWKARAARVEAPLLRRVERKAVEKVDVTVVVSDDDERRLPGRPRTLVRCPNGWTPTEPLPMGDEPVVVFVALLSWQPNVDAAVWFSREVWPKVRAGHPGARLLLVGRSPAPSVRALAAPDIEVTGTVPDVRPYLQRARLAVAPLLSGGGTRLKVLEALDAGRPIVGTSIGLEGLTDLHGRGAVVADGADAMAEEVLALLHSRDKAESLGEEGHRSVAERYSWDRVLQPLLEALPT